MGALGCGGSCGDEAFVAFFEGLEGLGGVGWLDCLVHIVHRLPLWIGLVGGIVNMARAVG